MTAHEPRLVVSRRAARRDHLHGSWWPHTTNAHDELGPMIALAAARFGPILGVMLSGDEWPVADAAERRTHVGRTKISWYGLSESNLAVLVCVQGRRIVLLVVPPETPEPVALTAAMLASSPGNSNTAAEVLSRARDR